MKTCKPFKRNFRTGQLVMLSVGGPPMRVLKYDDKLSEELSRHIVSVTWLENRRYKLARYDETELVPFLKATV